MRPIAIFTLAAALSSIAPPAARAGGAPAPASRVPNASTRAAALLHERERGTSPFASCTTERRRRARMAHNGSSIPASTLQSYLYVIDACGPVIDVLHTRTYGELGYFSDGLIEPVDAFVDSHGNLYVANFVSGSGYDGYVTEYATGNLNAPSFTYNANMLYPLAVTTDARGNVYEGDAYGIINEYYPNRNVSIASCQPLNNSNNTTVEGVAVDSHNDVFATVFDNNAQVFALVEYPGGLNNCNSRTVLPVYLNFMYGIAVDKSGNLLISDISGVAVVDPPYSAVTTQIVTSSGGATNVRLNKLNGLLFVTSTESGTVTVVNYPSGTTSIVLGSANGLSQPFAAVEQPNAVY